MKKIIILLITLSIVFATDLQDINPSPYFTSMAGAGTAIESTAYAPFMNPAGIGKSINISVSTFKILGQIDYTYIGFCTPFYVGNIAFGYSRTSDGGYKKTSYVEGQPAITGLDFSYNTHIYGFAWSYELENFFTKDASFKIGIAGKRLEEYLDTGYGAATIVDFGVQYSPNSFLTVAYTLYNANSPQINWNQDIRSETISNKSIYGIAYSPFANIKIIADYKNDGYRKPGLAMGGEYRLLNTLALRCGYTEGSFYTGLGVSFNELRIDMSYAMANYEYQSESYKLSLAYDFSWNNNAIENNKLMPTVNNEEISSPEPSIMNNLIEMELLVKPNGVIVSGRTTLANAVYLNNDKILFDDKTIFFGKKGVKEVNIKFDTNNGPINYSIHLNKDKNFELISDIDVHKYNVIINNQIQTETISSKYIINQGYYSLKIIVYSRQ